MTFWRLQVEFSRYKVLGKTTMIYLHNVMIASVTLFDLLDISIQVLLALYILLDILLQVLTLLIYI